MLNSIPHFITCKKKKKIHFSFLYQGKSIVDICLFTLYLWLFFFHQFVFGLWIPTSKIGRSSFGLAFLTPLQWGLFLKIVPLIVPFCLLFSWLFNNILLIGWWHHSFTLHKRVFGQIAPTAPSLLVERRRRWLPFLTLLCFGACRVEIWKVG